MVDWPNTGSPYCENITEEKKKNRTDNKQRTLMLFIMNPLYKFYLIVLHRFFFFTPNETIFASLEISNPHNKDLAFVFAGNLSS